MDEAESSELLRPQGEAGSLAAPGNEVKPVGGQNYGSVSTPAEGDRMPTAPAGGPEHPADDMWTPTWGKFGLLLLAIAVLQFIATSVNPGNTSGASSVGLDGASNHIAFQESAGGGKLVTSMAHPVPRNRKWGSTHMPYPTGAFWTNFVQPSASDASPSSQPPRGSDGSRNVQEQQAEPLVLSPAIAMEDEGVVAVYPYDVKCGPSGVATSYSAYRRFVKSDAIATMFVPDAVLGAAKVVPDREGRGSGWVAVDAGAEAAASGGLPEHSDAYEVVRYDNASVTVRFSRSNVPLYDAHLVKGSPFVTTTYFPQSPSPATASVVPTLSSEFEILSVDRFDPETGEATPASLAANETETAPTASSSSGPQFFIVHLANFQQWLVAAHADSGSMRPVFSADVNAINRRKVLVFISDRSGGSAGLRGAEAAATMLRVAVLPLQHPLEAAKLLAEGAACYPTGMDMSVGRVKHSNDLQLVYDFRVGGVCGSEVEPHKEVLMLALPHHLPLMKAAEGVDNAIVLADPSYAPYIYCAKGRMTPVRGRRWVLQYKEARKQPQWHFGSDGQTPSPSQVSTIGSFLTTDLYGDETVLLPVDASPYEFGKRISRVARLALTADELLHMGVGEDDDDQLSTSQLLQYRSDAVVRLRDALEKWLNGSTLEPTSMPLGDVAETLVYDSTYGGMVPRHGLQDPVADFGAGYYSDHHFHYGYVLFAIATLKKLGGGDGGDVSGRLSFVSDLIFRDVCNMDKDAKLSYPGGDEQGEYQFPYMRHKDFFDGHSWASGGLFKQGNGKGQESSSEAINAYYGCVLYADVIDQSAGYRDLLSLALAMEVFSTQHYWHMKDSSVYDAIFAVNRMVGNIGGTDVTASTWFGKQMAFVHGINILPVIPPTAQLFQDLDFVTLQWDRLRSGIPGLEATARTKAGEAKQVQAMQESEGRISNEWKALLQAVHAVIDKDAAWEEMLALVNTSPDGDHIQYDLGTGSSMSASLLWIASRPAVSAKRREIPTATGEVYDNFDITSAIDKSCGANSACVTAGMLESNECCPVTIVVGNTTSFLSLGCCPIVVPPEQ